MKLIFIHGPAAAGKLTVGRALQTATDLRLFHNHLVVDALLAVFPFGSEPFVRLREAMWLSVFEEAARAGTSLIFTFAPEGTVSSSFIEKAMATVNGQGGTVCFVELICPIEEQERRIENPSRKQSLKLSSLKMLRELRNTKFDAFPRLPSSGLVLDTSTLTPEESAQRISDFFKIPVVAYER